MNVNEVLDGHVVLDVRGPPVPERVRAEPPGRGPGRALLRHLGQPIAFPAVIQKIGNRFRREVKAFARAGGFPCSS